MSIARQAALDELKNDLDINRTKLEKMMGIDKLMENSKKIVPDEIAE